MNHPQPPLLLQNLLQAFLPARDQETVFGDLLEAYAERRHHNRAFRANLWFALQTVSFAPRGTLAALAQEPRLVFFCSFTSACGAWLGTMDVLLHHPNLLRHETIAGLIVGQGLLTLLTLPLFRFRLLRWLVFTGTLAVTWLGGKALVAVVRGDYSFDGYILIIAAALIVQAALTWRALLRHQAASA